MSFSLNECDFPQNGTSLFPEISEIPEKWDPCILEEDCDDPHDRTDQIFEDFCSALIKCKTSMVFKTDRRSLRCSVRLFKWKLTLTIPFVFVCFVFLLNMKVPIVSSST